MSHERDTALRHLPSSAMAPGRKVSADLAWAVIRMSSVLSKADISSYTRLSIRTIETICARFRRMGDVVTVREIRRRRRTLTAGDVEFLQHSLDETPDLYLDELQHALRNH
ncbi:hypothetical protein M422DRAFT_245201 [Sphaerobolus stellatus SS14]|nr:hypothetical protein M422DRAFT_245201 [Sphaerobolus stellatus SS14]